MSKKKEEFLPKWVTEEASPRSYRSISRWGDPKFVKFPKPALYKFMKQTFKMTDEDFKHYHNDIGFEDVDIKIPTKMSEENIKGLSAIVGEKNISLDVYDRLSVMYGKTLYDVMRIREHKFDSVPDIVLYPEDSEQIEKIVDYCTKNKIPLYVYGGGSSVTRGVEPVKGGVSLDMRRNFNKVLSFNDVDQTITVQAGMSGPDLEKHLNNAIKEFNASRAYTCGHFPQSFEYSSVGGWVVTRGAGQNSTYYGVIADIVLSQKYATPIGTIKTSHYPRESTGPNLNQIMMGSEGTFGVLTEVTLRVFRYMPENRKRYSYMFKNWQDAMNAAREIMQSEGGNPSAFRVSDPEETDMMLKLYNVDDSPLRYFLTGFEPMKRSLMLGFTEGEKGYSKNVRKTIARVAKKYHARSLTGLVCKSWEHGRFNDPYLRDTLLDFGIATDTLECTVNWSNMAKVHEEVRKICHARPNTVVTTHLSHAYPQGANLYFIFITHSENSEDFKKYHTTILDAIQKSGAAISHHHGIGKMFAPWLEGYMGRKEYGVYHVLKDYFDKDYLMNPGGTIGLDLEEKDKKFLRDDIK
jgi:alkyldihydroxyacetonephosphate synthase